MKKMAWTIQAGYILGLVVLSGCASTTPPAPLVPVQLGTSQDQVAIQALHRRLHEQEQTIAIQNRRIEVMFSQLDALKRIDQDTMDRRRPMRRSVIVAP